MATSNILRETVGEVTECSICTETMVDPRVLPCIHTFCFKCLDQLWKDKQPRVKVPCPLCRTEAVIPVEGVSSLPKNFFVEKLIGAQKLSKSQNEVVMCDICLTNDNTGTSESVSEKFCIECQQHICERCLKCHSSLSTTKTHQVIPAGNKSAATMAQYPETSCALHNKERIKIYCLECKVAVCTICFITKHNRHECSDTQSVAEDLKKQIRSNIEETRGNVAEAGNQSKSLKNLMGKFEVSVKEAQSRIVEAGEKMKHLVDQHVQVLLGELEDERTKKAKEFEIVKEELLIQKLSLESLMKYSEKILENAIPDEVASVAKDLSVRFESLKCFKIARIGNSLEMTFLPHDLQILSLGDGKSKNVLGKVGVHGEIVDGSTRVSTTMTKGEMSAKTTYQRSAKGPVAIVDCFLGGKYIALENNGRKAENMKGWKVRRSIDGFYRADFTLEVVIPAGLKIMIWAKGMKPGNAPPTDLEYNESSCDVGGNILTQLVNPMDEVWATYVTKTIYS